MPPLAAADRPPMAAQPLPESADAHPSGGRPLLGASLVRRGRLNTEGLEQALAEQERSGLPLGRVLVGLGLITTRDLAEALAEQHGLAFVDLSETQMDDEAVTLLPESVARRYEAVPVRVENGSLVVAVADPTNILAHDDLRLALGTDLRIVVTDAAQLEDAMGRRYQMTTLGSVETFSSSAWRADEDDERVQLDDTAPAIMFVNDVISRALAHRASDIHFEPQADRLVVRVRVDGVTRELTEIETSQQAAVIARLKVMGGLDIAQRRTAQDGRVGIKVGGHPMDLRIAVLPTTYGEQAVLRILQGTGTKGPLALSDLGMDSDTEGILRRAIERPYGAIITVGPTGSGKTTTLYAALAVLNEPGRVIVTIEDPVEYQMPGAGQIEIDPPAGLTFARGLRTILRSDPDVILVGEIRDEETARIAMQAATTGHLVLSTLHAQSASSSIVRLKDMGVDPGLLAPSLNCIVAQRLARRLCVKCREPYAPTDLERQRFDLDSLGTIEHLYRPRGCETCLQTGFEGRVALYEAMSVEGKIRRLIDAPTEEIFAAAVEQGMTTLRDSGIRLALAGITSLGEIHRVTGDRLL
jgi:type IV pilus assembly protein PilB